MKIKLGQGLAFHVLHALRDQVTYGRDKLEALFESPLGCEFTVKPIKPARTRSQEKYYRKWCGEFAKHTGETPDDMHEIMLLRTYGTKIVSTAFGDYRLPEKRSADTTIDTYGELIETLIRCAAFAGFVIPPAERAA